jgi:hypothetical protein
MSLPQKLKLTRLIAIASCLLAFGSYFTFAPTSYADIAPLLDAEMGAQCTYAGQKYDVGACRSKQRCMNDGGGNPYWADDPSCP